MHYHSYFAVTYQKPIHKNRLQTGNYAACTSAPCRVIAAEQALDIFHPAVPTEWTSLMSFSNKVAFHLKGENIRINTFPRTVGKN